MLILQGGWDGSRLLLWAETPAESAQGATKPRRNRSATSTAQSFPYDPGLERLRTALAEGVCGFSVESIATQGMVAWLPTVAGQPVASSPLIAATGTAHTSATLAPWAVHVLVLTPASAIEFLCRCVGKETLAPGLIVGKTLAFWTEAVRLAGALVGRQQFLPSFNKATARARWVPSFSGADRQRLALLVKAMPPACRALSATVEQPPQTCAEPILVEFLTDMVDALVRGVSAPAPSVPRIARASKAAFDSMHDQWVSALRSADGVMDVDDEEADQLAAQVEEWRRPIAATTQAPFRLCLRLEEPKSNGDAGAEIGAPDKWYLRYLLQAADDPSLLVPVPDALRRKVSAAALGAKRSALVREYVLTALGEATRQWPLVEKSLKTATPAGLDLDAVSAHAFLTEKAWLLEQAGLGVLLPAWWTRTGTKQRLSVSARVASSSMKTGTGLGLDQILAFDWQLALGDQEISLEQLQALARLKVPLVRVRGQWVQISGEEIQAALQFWKNQKTGEASAREVLRMALAGTASTDGVAFGGVQATGWLAELLERLEGRQSFQELPKPDTFAGTLRPYQQRGYSWLGFLQQWGLGACLADDMGLGKTVQALALIEHRWEEGERQPTLIVCPMSVVGNWQKEAERFTPGLPVLVHHGSQRRRGDSFRKQAEKHALVISSFGLLHRDLPMLQQVSWAGVILDEAQNIKNPETRQARAARSLGAGYRIALTGTPVENHVGDLWSIMEFLNPGFLGSRTDFKRKFLLPIQGSRDPDAADRLRRITGPFILRRLKTDESIIADLPRKLEMKVFCNLTREQASLYAAVVEEANQTLDSAKPGIQRKGMILAMLSRLKQVCNHPAQFLGDHSTIGERSGKLARLTEMLSEALEAGDRALVFTQFREMGAIIQTHLQETFGREVLFLHGGTSKKQRDTLVARFQAAKDGEASGPQVFVLSLKAGGTGLNLTAANHVFHFDRWWNPAVENQATDRAFRIGQKRNVQVHKFVCIGTLEEKIDAMIEQKQAVAEKVVGTGEAWLTELSNEELKNLFALRREALGE